MKTIFTVLKTGGEYEPTHVRWLHRQCQIHAPNAEFVCLTDVSGGVSGVRCEPLIREWSGWWSKIELFRFKDVFYLDLDTVILNNIEYMFDLPDFYALQNVAGHKLKARVSMGSGIMSWHGKYEGVYANFDYSRIRKYSKRQNLWGDQGYIQEIIPGWKSLQNAFPGRIHSYKFSGIDVENPKSDIVVFSGNPRPWKVSHSWVPPICS